MTPEERLDQALARRGSLPSAGAYDQAEHDGMIHGLKVAAGHAPALPTDTDENTDGITAAWWRGYHNGANA